MTAGHRSPQPHTVRRGTGVPLLFVHGNGVDHRLLLELDEVFAADGDWERIYLDLPGFGRTPALPGRGGLPDLADWLAGWTAETLGETPFAVVGNSMGGLLAADLVSRRRDTALGLALLAPVVESRHGRRSLPTVAVSRDAELLASLDPRDADEYAAVAVEQSHINWELFRRAALPGLRAGDPAAMKRLGATYDLPMPSLEDFDRPVVMITGRQDTIVGFADQARWARGLPQGLHVTIDRAGHNVHLDQPQGVADLLSGWARRVRAR